MDRDNNHSSNCCCNALKEELATLNKLLTDQDELRTRYYHHGLSEHPEKAVRDAAIRAETAEEALSSERKETERLRTLVKELEDHIRGLSIL